MNPTSSTADAFPAPLFYEPARQYRVTLRTSPHSVRHLRRIVRAYTRLWGMGCLADAAELAVSELVGNVIRHVPDSYYTLRLLRQPEGVRLEVVDNCPELPELREADGLDESGRGLALLALVTDAWGAEPLEEGKGKTVWCELVAKPSPTRDG